MGDRSLTVLTTTFSRAMALSMRAFCAAVSLRAGRTSSGFFFLPTSGRPWADKEVATKVASSRPAVECFRKIMIYGSCDDLRVIPHTKQGDLSLPDRQRGGSLELVLTS